jgi:hypothetical protein
MPCAARCSINIRGISRSSTCWPRNQAGKRRAPRMKSTAWRCTSRSARSSAKSRN